MVTDRFAGVKSADDSVVAIITQNGELVITYEFSSWADLNAFLVDVASRTRVLDAGRFSLTIGVAQEPS